MLVQRPDFRTTVFGGPVEEDEEAMGEQLSHL